MGSRLLTLAVLSAVFFHYRVSSEETESVPAASDDSSVDMDKRGGGRSFVGSYDSYYPSMKRLSDYSFYNKRGGGRAYYPIDEEKRGGGRAYFPSEDKRGGGRAYHSSIEDDKRGGGRAYFPVVKRGGGRAFAPIMEKRGGGRAFIGDWAYAYPRMERRGGGRAFSGDYMNYGGRSYDSPYYKRSNLWSVLEDRHYF